MNFKKTKKKQSKEKNFIQNHLEIESFHRERTTNTTKKKKKKKKNERERKPENKKQKANDRRGRDITRTHSEKYQLVL